MSIKELRKKIQRTIKNLADHDRRDLALHELRLIRETVDDTITDMEMRQQLECEATR